MTCQQEQMFKLFELTRLTYSHQRTSILFLLTSDEKKRKYKDETLEDIYVYIILCTKNEHFLIIQTHNHINIINLFINIKGVISMLVGVRVWV